MHVTFRGWPTTSPRYDATCLESPPTRRKSPSGSRTRGSRTSTRWRSTCPVLGSSLRARTSCGPPSPASFARNSPPKPVAVLAREETREGQGSVAMAASAREPRVPAPRRSPRRGLRRSPSGFRRRARGRSPGHVRGSVVPPTLPYTDGATRYRVLKLVTGRVPRGPLERDLAQRGAGSHGPFETLKKKPAEPATRPTQAPARFSPRSMSVFEAAERPSRRRPKLEEASKEGERAPDEVKLTVQTRGSALKSRPGEPGKSPVRVRA